MLFPVVPWCGSRSAFTHIVTQLLLMPLIIVAPCWSTLSIVKICMFLNSSPGQYYSQAFGAYPALEQALSNIKTVMSFNGQDSLTAKYRAALRLPQHVATKQGILGGATLGSVMGILYCSYALALWCAPPERFVSIHATTRVKHLILRLCACIMVRSSCFTPCYTPCKTS